MFNDEQYGQYSRRAIYLRHATAVILLSIGISRLIGPNVKPIAVVFTISMPDCSDRLPIEKRRLYRMTNRRPTDSEPGETVVPLLEQDRERLQRCLSGDKAAWRELWRKNLHVVRLAVEQAGGAELSTESVKSAIRVVANRLMENDFRILRQFRGKASFTVYLAIYALRIASGHFAAQKLRKSA